MGQKQSNAAVSGTLFRWYPDDKHGLVSLGYQCDKGEISVNVKHFQGPPQDKKMLNEATAKQLRDRKVQVILATRKKSGRYWAQYWWLSE